MLVKKLDDSLIADIGHAFAHYDYGGETGLFSLYSSPEAVATYICGYTRAMLRAGFLYTNGEGFEGFAAYKLPGQPIPPLAFLPLLHGFFQSTKFPELVRLIRCMKHGGASLRDRMDKEKKPYIFVGLVCVREAYQGQGFMRKTLALPFAEGNRLGVPVILETDAQSKCDKYMHLGMELAGVRDLGELGKLYDLIKYPEEAT